MNYLFKSGLAFDDHKMPAEVLTDPHVSTSDRINTTFHVKDQNGKYELDKKRHTNCFWDKDVCYYLSWSCAYIVQLQCMIYQ